MSQKVVIAIRAREKARAAALRPAKPKKPKAEKKAE